MIKRTIKEAILRCIHNKPVTLITGSRQVGKSTLCYEIKKELGFDYISLDDIREREMAIKDPEMFLKLHKWPLIIDEVQYAPKLFEVIEAIVNKQKLEKGSNYGMYILTGSQIYELMNGVTQSLAGRVAIIRMSPLSSREIYGLKEFKMSFDPIELSTRSKEFKLDVDDLYKLIVKGMYPELYDNPNLDTNMFYSNYVNTYIERDVSQIINLKDKLKFQNFLEVIASLTGQELVFDTIAKAIGVKTDTIKSWISVLLAGDIIHLLEPYNELSIVKRVVKRPKIYFSDTGLACYLAKLNNANVLKNSLFNGRFIETYIVNEIRKSFLNNGMIPNFYYYRDTNQNEIDLIILDEGILHLIECKAGVSFSKNDIRSFDKLKKSNYQIGHSYIICNTSSIYKIDDDVFAVPITSI